MSRRPKPGNEMNGGRKMGDGLFYSTVSQQIGDAGGGNLLIASSEHASLSTLAVSRVLYTKIIPFAIRFDKN